MSRESIACDFYTDNDIELRVYQYDDPLAVRYIIKSGVTCLDLSEDNFWTLVNILDEYIVYGLKVSWWKRALRKIRRR